MDLPAHAGVIVLRTAYPGSIPSPVFRARPAPRRLFSISISRRSRGGMDRTDGGDQNASVAAGTGIARSGSLRPKAPLWRCRAVLCMRCAYSLLRVHDRTRLRKLHDIACRSHDRCDGMACTDGKDRCRQVNDQPRSLYGNPRRSRPCLSRICRRNLRISGACHRLIDR